MNEYPDACHLCEYEYRDFVGLSRHVMYIHNGNWNGVDGKRYTPERPQSTKPAYVIQEEP